jgi:hypothetical protein
MVDNIPENLEEALTFLESQSTQKELEEFKQANEDNMVAMLHHFTGQQIRNDWKLWFPKDSPLGQWFVREHHIWHADDMSSIIIRSLHRKLNGKDLKLEEQVKKYHDYWILNGIGTDRYSDYLIEEKQ